MKDDTASRLPVIHHKGGLKKTITNVGLQPLRN